MPPPKKTTTMGTTVPSTPRASTISTPLPTGAVVAKTGIVTTTINNIEITILPDKVVSKLESPTASARTDRSWSTKAINYSSKPHPTDKTKRLIQNFTVKPLKVTIATVYKRGESPLLPSTYGSGTTERDIAAGNISLQFHEGSHGKRTLQFFQDNVPPVFGGKIDMTVEEFDAAWETYQTEIKTYFEELELRQKRDVECVGKPMNTTLCSTLATPNPKYK